MFTIVCVNNPDFTVEFVTTLLKDLNVSPWIGLQKLSSGELRWVDNNDVTYTNWYQGEPNGGVGAVSIQKRGGGLCQCLQAVWNEEQQDRINITVSCHLYFIINIIFSANVW